MSRSLSRSSIGVAATALMAALAPDPSDARPLELFDWSARPLLVFADADGAALQTQLARFSGREAELLDRKMPLLVISDGRVDVDGRASQLDAEALRAAYDVGADAFAIILVGKDTGVKFRAAAPAEASELFDLVDAMPMRLREVRQREHATD